MFFFGKISNNKTKNKNQLLQAGIFKKLYTSVLVIKKQKRSKNKNKNFKQS
jgi:hypothetical protein